MRPEITNPLMNAKEAAEYLHCSEATLRYWRFAGIGPTFTKPAGRVFYHKRDLDEYLAQGRQVPAVRAVLGT
jgi:predicted site-specific integrase-resolvase